MSQRRISHNQRLMFVTTNTRDRSPIFLNPVYARIAVERLYHVQGIHPFFLYSFVIMPDHCHFLVHVPEFKTISKIMYAYKRSVAFEIGKPVWQARYYVKHVSDPSHVIQYIQMNPVHKNLCATASEYPWSSASGRWDLSELQLM
jgi:putative transposase